MLDSPQILNSGLHLPWMRFSPWQHQVRIQSPYLLQKSMRLHQHHVFRGLRSNRSYLRAFVHTFEPGVVYCSMQLIKLVIAESRNTVLSILFIKTQASRQVRTPSILIYPTYSHWMKRRKASGLSFSIALNPAIASATVSGIEVAWIEGEKAVRPDSMKLFISIPNSDFGYRSIFRFRAKNNWHNPIKV